MPLKYLALGIASRVDLLPHAGNSCRGTGIPKINIVGSEWKYFGEKLSIIKSTLLRALR